MPRTGAAPCRASQPAAEQLRLFEYGIDLGELRMERQALADEARSENTRRAYASDWRDFERWCESASLSALPASADSLSLYLVDLARVGRLPSTLSRRVCSVSAAHLAAGHPSPATADVQEVLAAIGRRVGVAPVHRKAAVSIDALRRMVGVCGEGARGARDRALLLLGFASGLRRSELAALDLADVEERPEGVVLLVRRSKTDQSGVGRQVGVNRGVRRSTCPARALAAWLVERGGWAGPLFPQLVQPGDAVTHKRMQGRAVAEVVKAAARRAGLDASVYGGHSLRAGCATTAAENGASDLAIMARTGHRSVAMVGRYVRSGSLFALDPLAGAL
jgi:integrase